MSSSTSINSKQQTQEDEFYDDIYFDTDAEDTDGEPLPSGSNQNTNSKSRKKVLSNDELLYDPDMDDNDESWVIKQINKDSMKQDKNIPIEKKTDAILTCPMCFTTLCYSCQRHEKFANQFRAMFVHNCHAIKNERYKYEDEYYYKVVCDNCGIQVAMMEEDEIYHFFNVVPT